MMSASAISPMTLTRRSPLSMCATHDADVQVIDRSLRSCLATSTWLSPARRRAAAIAAPSSAEISRFDMRASGQLRPERQFNVVFPSQAYPNTAQSCGFELAAPGLMSFQKVKLPSAPSLYSSLPPFAALLALNHSALLNVDSGVESGSFAAVLTGSGLKPRPMSVHCVTLPSFPNLNSCWPWVGVWPVNHNASLKTVILFGCKPPPVPGLAVHFVTLPSNPNLYS